MSRLGSTLTQTMLAASAIAAASQPVAAADLQKIDQEARNAYGALIDQRPWLGDIADSAVAALVIPDVIKASFVVGGAYGEGALLSNGRTTGYWSYAAGSIGYQAGAQRTSQVLFFMTEDALAGFKAREGIEIGADFEITVIDQGGEAAIDSTVQTAPVIAVVFNRQGLLAGASLQGGKYSRLD